MKYKKRFIAFSILMVTLLLTGCKGKGEAFIGHWVEILKINSSYSTPSTLTIANDDGVFHINMTSFRNVMKTPLNKDGSFEEKYEAKAESETVLSVIGGRENPLRLTDDVIYFSDREFKKID